jgi:hypothetical protein
MMKLRREGGRTMPDDPNSDVYLPRERTHMERAASAPMDALRAENDRLRKALNNLSAAARNALSDIRPRSPVRRPLEEALERAKRAT